MRWSKFLLVFLMGGLVFSFNVSLNGFFFAPSDKVFKDVYGSSALSFGLEGEVGFSKFGFFAGAEYLKKTGKTTYTEEEVSLSLLPLYVGIRYYPISGFTSMFVEAGSGTWKYSEKASFASSSGSIFGFFAGAGLQMKMMGSMTVRLLMRYQHVKKEFEEDGETFTTDLSGLKTGLAFVFSF